ALSQNPASISRLVRHWALGRHQPLTTMEACDMTGLVAAKPPGFIHPTLLTATCHGDGLAQPLGVAPVALGDGGRGDEAAAAVTASSACPAASLPGIM
ncbi:hypothetical protein, partial [Falsiroseomonas tokyonensis]